MKPIIIFCFIFFLSVVMNCTVRNYKLPFQRTKPHVIIQDITVPEKKLQLVPVPVTPRDTAKPSPPQKNKEAVVIHSLDTATLRQWFDQVHFDGRYRTSIMDDHRVLGVVSQMGATMEENEALVRQLIHSIEEKGKAQQEVKAIKNAVFNGPLYIWSLHILFVLIMVLMIYKVHYSRIKIQAYIDGKIKKL